MRVVTAAILISLLSGAGAAMAAASSDTPAFSTSRDDVAVMLWLKRNTSLRLGQSVVFSDDNVLVISSDTVDADRPTLHRVSFRQEATSVDFVGRTGGRSIRGGADVDCITGKVKAMSIALFSGSDMRGDQILSQGPDAEFRAPVYGTASALVVAEVCAQRKPGQVTASNQPSRPPVPAAPPSPPVPPPARSAPQAQRPPAPRRPAPAPTPVPAPEPPPAPPPALARSAGPETIAQIGAFGSRDAAESAWDQLRATFPEQMAGKSARIEPAMVNGAEVYRTSVIGFASDAAARAACAELMARSQACFVRRTP